MISRERCELCGSGRREPYLESRPLRYVRCRDCSLIYSDTVLEVGELRQVYSAPYFDEHYRYAQPSAFEHHHYLAQGIVRQIESLHGRAGRLLELGPATGFLLKAARERGWEVCGVELSEYAAKVAREVHGLPVLTGTLLDHSLPGGFFDVVVALHCIEHIVELHPTLEAMRRLLCPGGLLVVEVPNADCPQALSQGVRWEHLHPDQHLYQFTRRPLLALLARHGFEPVWEDTTGTLRLTDPFRRYDRIGIIDWVHRHMRYFGWLRALIMATKRITGRGREFIRVVVRKGAMPTAAAGS